MSAAAGRVRVQYINIQYILYIVHLFIQMRLLDGKVTSQPTTDIRQGITVLGFFTVWPYGFHPSFYLKTSNTRQRQTECSPIPLRAIIQSKRCRYVRLRFVSFEAMQRRR